MPRPHPTDTKREITLQIPDSLFTRVEARLRDPLSGRLAYGARSKLINSLLAAWLEGLESSPMGQRYLPLPLSEDDTRHLLAQDNLPRSLRDRLDAHLEGFV